jgi:hypothetical protein
MNRALRGSTRSTSIRRANLDEVTYALRHFADMDPAAEPGLDNIRT